ncbi:hypothetical protein LCGC14_1719130 [marine sediment metagenome]|uniref:Uncharacterized protein n=1 Tax=marine sediment metagenome TaxID=412755 RepID=A0A0F9I0M8_9ZZZZ
MMPEHIKEIYRTVLIKKIGISIERREWWENPQHYRLSIFYNGVPYYDSITLRPGNDL